MKKQLLIVGVILILLTVGFSGCNEDSNNNKISSETTSIFDIQKNPEKYIGKNVTIEATPILTTPYDIPIGINNYFTDHTTSIYAVYPDNFPKLTYGVMYYFYGTIYQEVSNTKFGEFLFIKVIDVNPV